MTKMTSTTATATWIMNNYEQSSDLMENDSPNDHLNHCNADSVDTSTIEEASDSQSFNKEPAEKDDEPLNRDLLGPIDYNMSPRKGLNGHLTDDPPLTNDLPGVNEYQIKDDDQSNGDPVARIPSCTSDESHYGPYYRNSSGSLEDDDDDEYDEVLHDPIAVTSKLKEMEEEQEQLNNSLIALTSHFAQVQLRLKQIVGASSDEKERLLKELEEFAFTGIPDLNSVHQIVNQTQNQIGSQNISRFNSTSDEDGGKDDTSSLSNVAKTSNCKSKLNNESDLPSKLEMQREKQKELMGKLKEQLEELEKYAYETGDSKCIPSSMLIERQSVIIEQLKGTLALNLDQMDKLSPEELRQQVNMALKNLIDPVIMKEQLVEQLKTQVTDLERFIEYLQAGQVSIKCKNGSHFKLSTDGQCTCACPLHGNSVTSVQKYNPLVANERKKQLKKKQTANGKGDCYNGDDEDDADADDHGSREAIKMIKRVMTLLQMVTVTQFGCNKTVKKYERNIFNKKSPNGPNCYDKNDLWNDLKAKLDDAIDHLIEITQEKFANDSDYTSDSDDNVFTSNDDPASVEDENSGKGHTQCNNKSETITSHEISSQGLRNQKLTHVVRKDLCNALVDLLEHGLREDAEVSNTLIDLNGHQRSQSSAIVSSFLIWGCFSDQSSNIDGRYSSTSSSSKDGKWQRPTVWDVFMKFYHLKDGTCYTSTPARRLSQSFNLPIVGGNVVTPKQSLLMAIYDICESHTPLKRSPESHFKALISRSLNEGKITSWLRLIVKSRSIIQSMYEPWSYVASTGFDEALESLEKLNSIRFNLPTDLAIRQLKSISDAF